MSPCSSLMEAEVWTQGVAWELRLGAERVLLLPAARPTLSPEAASLSKLSKPWLPAERRTLSPVPA